MSAPVAAPPLTDGEVAILVALAKLPGIGPGTLARCREEAGLDAAWARVEAGAARSVRMLAGAFRGEEARQAALAAAMAQAARTLDPADLLGRHRAAGRSVLVYGTDDYPGRLAGDPDAPAVVFATGDLTVLDAPTVAIVGTRNATRAGRDLASVWARELASVGVSVISGLALGIDGAAHQGALAALAPDPAGASPGSVRPFGVRSAPVGVGRPVGVVAAGLDIAYPRRHAPLHRAVAASGLLLSETPLGDRPTAWRFPARNRIIAGLADALLVVESRSRGGSMLTAGEALRRDITVLAVPGHPTSAAAAGTNDLLSEGAVVARDVDDVLVAVGLGGAAAGRADPPVTVSSGPDGGGRAVGPTASERAVLDALGEHPRSLDEILGTTALGLEVVSVALAELEGRGEVVRTGAWFEVVQAGSPGAGQGLAGWSR